MVEEQVRIVEHEPFDAEGAQVVAAFPCVGLVATIAANFLIEELGLKEVGVVDGPEFPTLCVVEDGLPKSAVRIYSGTYATEDSKDNHLVIFLSEFQPDPRLIRPIAEAVLSWAREKKVDLIVSPEGLVLEGEAAEDNIVEVYTVGSTERTREILKNANAPLFKDGVVAGVTGTLLTLASREQQDVVAILSEAKKEHPDARSAATVIELLADMVGASMDAARLYDEADTFEKKVLKEARKQKRQQIAANKSQELMFH